jgi:ketosteroid isomerase-like protein
MTEPLQRLYEAWNRDDPDVLVSFVHPDVEFRTSGHFPDLPDAYSGIEGIRAFHEQFTAPWESLEIEPCRYETNGERALALWRFRGIGRGGVPVEREGAHIAVVRDGLIVDIQGYGSWKEALADAGLES